MFDVDVRVEIGTGEALFDEEKKASLHRKQVMREQTQKLLGSWSEMYGDDELKLE